MIILLDAEKAFDKIEPPLHDKGLGENFHNQEKGNLQGRTLNPSCQQ